jgi:hypothetical protein
LELQELRRSGAGFERHFIFIGFFNSAGYLELIFVFGAPASLAL